MVKHSTWGEGENERVKPGTKIKEKFTATAVFSTRIKQFIGTGPEVNTWMVKQRKKGATKVFYERRDK